MKLPAKELEKIASVVKHFLSRTIIDDSLRYVYFYRNKITARSSFAWVFYKPTFKLEKEFAIPFDMFVKLGSLFEQTSEVDIKFVEDKIRWKFGSYRYISPIVDLVTSNFPSPKDDDKSVGIEKGFLNTLSKAIFAAGEDTRHQEFYGVCIDKGEVWACDGARAYGKQIKDVSFEEIEELFLTQELLTVLFGLDMDPSILILSENKMFFAYEEPEVYICTPMVGFKSPDVSLIFKKIVLSQAVTKVTGYRKEDEEGKKLKGFLSVLEKEGGQTLDVFLSGTEMKLVLQSSIRKDEFTLFLVVKQTAKEDVQIKVKPEYFIEALLRYNTFYIFPQRLYMENKSSKHLIMLKE